MRFCIELLNICFASGTINYFSEDRSISLCKEFITLYNSPPFSEKGDLWILFVCSFIVLFGLFYWAFFNQLPPPTIKEIKKTLHLDCIKAPFQQSRK